MKSAKSELIHKLKEAEGTVRKERSGNDPICQRSHLSTRESNIRTGLLPVSRHPPKHTNTIPMGNLCCMGSNNRHKSGSMRRKGTKVGANKADLDMSNRMKAFTEKRDEQLNKDVEGQLLAKLLTTVRETYGADSQEYNGFRELLVAGMFVEELQARFESLEQGSAKYPPDSPEYSAYRDKVLYNPNAGGRGSAAPVAAVAPAATTTLDASQGEGDEHHKKKKKKKKKKHKHKHH